MTASLEQVLTLLRCRGWVSNIGGVDQATTHFIQRAAWLSRWRMTRARLSDPPVINGFRLDRPVAGYK